MNRRIFVFLMLLLPLVASAQGKLYERYAHRADLTVAQVAGYRLNDTAQIDVVMLVADDAKAWSSLMQELGVVSTEGVTSWLSDPDRPDRRVQWHGKGAVCRVVVSHARRTVAIYRLENEGQYDALADYQLQRMQSPQKKK